MDTFIKLTLIFFISFLSFSVGTFIGKQMSDNEYKQAAFKNKYQTLRGMNPSSNENLEEKPGSLEEAEEIARLSEEFIQSEREESQKEEMKKMGEIKPFPQEESHDKSPSEGQGDTFMKSSHKQQVKGLSKEIKAEDSEDSKDKFRKEGYKLLSRRKKKTSSSERKNSKEGDIREPSSLEKSQNFQEKVVTNLLNPKEKLDEKSFLKNDFQSDLQIKGSKKSLSHQLEEMKKFPYSKQAKYTLQLAAYIDEAEAKEHVSKLKSKGYSAFYVSALVKGKTWYRVSVGVFSNFKSAKNFQKEFNVQAKVSSSIVRKILN